jgi:hypothetical protein
MKTRILAAIALAVALPAAAQANSVMEQRAFAQQHETLNTQTTSGYQALPTEYRVATFDNGYSDEAGRALASVEESTRHGTHLIGGSNDLIGEGHSVAAAQALQNVNGGSDTGNVEVTFASLD